MKQKNYLLQKLFKMRLFKRKKEPVEITVDWAELERRFLTTKNEPIPEDRRVKGERLLALNLAGVPPAPEVLKEKEENDLLQKVQPFLIGEVLFFKTGFFKDSGIDISRITSRYHQEIPDNKLLKIEEYFSKIKKMRYAYQYTNYGDVYNCKIIKEDEAEKLPENYRVKNFYPDIFKIKNNYFVGVIIPAHGVVLITEL